VKEASLDNLVPLTKAQLKPAAEMVARAFRDEPLGVYLFPDLAEREKKLPGIFRSRLIYGLLYGGAVVFPNLEGVVVWVPSERSHRTLWRDIRSGRTAMLFSLGRKARARWKALGAYVGAMKKRHVPAAYCYGLLLAVDPAYQGQGYGGALLKAVLAEADREHRPCYLETLSQRDVSFFEHFGFSVVEEGLLPGTELKLWAMMREKK
jgi:GNAT superfamily N-acetyltransferase